MTIDEAIEDFKKMAENARNDIIDDDNIEPQESHYNTQLELYAKQCKQLANWLKELKAYRTLDKTNFLDGYNKAIDDFAEDMWNKVLFEEK